MMDILHPWQERAAERAQTLAQRYHHIPDALIVLGSGLATLPEDAHVVARVPLDELTAIAAPAVTGHPRELVLAEWNGHPIWFCLGRYHLYQGLSAAEAAAPIALLAHLPGPIVILTNAAGSLHPTFAPGDLVLIRDHFFVPGLAGHHPLIPPAGRVRFFSLRDAYDRHLRAVARAAAARLGLELPEGTYAMVAGPTFETAAELRWLRAAGADLVGMSTIPEVILARALGLRVLAISVVTNLAIPEEPAIPTHEEVAAIGEQARPRLHRLLGFFLDQLAEESDAVTGREPV
jgi:purine-nucleoside phosphorylase